MPTITTYTKPPSTTIKPPTIGAGSGAPINGGGTNIGSNTGSGGTGSGMGAPVLSHGGKKFPTNLTKSPVLVPVFIPDPYANTGTRQSSPDTSGGGGGAGGGGGSDDSGTDDKGVNVGIDHPAWGVKQYATLALGAIILGTAGFFLAKHKKWHGWKMAVSIGTGAVIGFASGFAVIKYVPPFKAK